jgi:putative ABC transport system ATP-binding protein
MIRMKKLEKTYRTDEVETLAIRDMSLDVNDGEFLAVMGPSGCGKSTLLNIVGMLDSPSGGEYWFGNENIAGYSEGQLSALRKQAIGFVFQSFNLIDELNVSENVELALLYHDDVPASERKKRVGEALERMKISHRARHMPSQLSGGQQQRVAIARALIADPTLLVCDEPTGDLDRASASDILGLIQVLNRQQGKTIVMVTHDQKAADYASRTLHVDKGQLVEAGEQNVASIA